jgi:cell wall-associated protease
MAPSRLQTGFFLRNQHRQSIFFSQRKNKTGKPVIVAVLDSGVDTTHEDLKPVLWRNPKEIPGNGIDDDGNGYIDDVYGWNFFGGKDGRDVNRAPDEKTRIYNRLKTKFSGKNIDTISLAHQTKTSITLEKSVR